MCVLCERKKINHGSDTKIALEMCLLRRWISHSFVAAGCILIMSVSLSADSSTHSTDDRNLMKIFFSFGCAYHIWRRLISSMFLWLENAITKIVSVPQNWFLCVYYNVCTFCYAGFQRILIAYVPRISDGSDTLTHIHKEDVDAFACLGICEYETLVCKIFQFYLLKFIHRRLDLSAVWFFVWRIMNETSSTMMMTKWYAIEPRQLNASQIKWTMFSEHVVFIIILIISLQSKLISLAVNFIKFKLIKLEMLICDWVCVKKCRQDTVEAVLEIIRNAPQSFIQFASNERMYFRIIATLA